MTVEGRSDVLVVGAGPTGCAAGIALARAGVDVCVVDRARFPRDKTCGDAVSNDAIAVVHELGAGSFVDAAPHALVRRAVAVFPDGTRVARDYTRPGYIVPRLHFDDCMRRALEGAGARVVQGERIASLTRNGDQVTGAEGPSLRWSAKVVIAADGYGSVGWSALGIQKPEGRHLAVSTTAYYEGVTFPDGDATSDHFFDEELLYGYGWIFPAVNGVANVGVYVRADVYARFDRSLKDLLAGFLERHRARFDHAVPVGKPRTWSLPIAPRPMPLGGAGILLAGDAAGLIDPLSGEGIWQGLHAGVLAGETAALAVGRGELGPDLVRAYERRLKRDIARPSRGKAAVQTALAVIVDKKLYRYRAVRAVLDWGYARGMLEMTKS